MLTLIAGRVCSACKVRMVSSMQVCFGGNLLTNHNRDNGWPLANQVRLAGHNKWSNIKHIKGAKDLQKSKTVNIFVNRIQTAIKQQGGDNNPKTNSALRKILAEATAANVPKSSVQTALKDTSEKMEVIMEVSLTGGVALLVEFIVKSRDIAAQELYILTRKKGGSVETRIKTPFDRKGVIVAEVPTSIDLESLEDDAIEAGAEEAELLSKEERTAEFITSVTDFSSVQDHLKERGYTFLDASLVYIPRFPVQAAPLEAKVAQNLYDMLMQSDNVVGVYKNF